jgi:DnaJ domain
MSEIKIDGQYVNPYFILDVVETDSETFITKSFKKKAKMWHPDKISKTDPSKVQYAKHHFKVLVESYEYIIHKMRSGHLNTKREHITVPKSNNIATKSIDNSNELDDFNSEFSKLHVDNPNDFGYSVERITDIKDYDNFEYKPYKLKFGNSKNFNKDEFNKAFEYQQTFHNNSELQVYHKTIDGFNPFNGCDLGGVASVSSYNGIMIVGDTFGQSGIGYYDTSYSDYKKTFDAPKNPETKLNIPDDFKQSTKTVKPLSNSETRKQLDLHITNRNLNLNNGNGQGKSKHEFKIQEQLLLEQQSQSIKQKIQDDKNIILQYQNLFNDKTLVQNALDGNLICSSDYCDESTIDKRHLQSKF